MKKKVHSETPFKAYQQHQLSFLPPSLDELIPEKHPVRIVNKIVEDIDLTPILKTYKSGGTSSYHPVILLKVLLYAYLRNIYSTRKMEEALRENIHFMWLSGNSQPDHNTLARFRSKRLKDHIEIIFSQMVHLLAEAGLVSLKEAFVDGTKIEANANRYTFVWGKAITYSKKRIQKQLDELITYADSVAKSEEAIPSVDFAELDSEKVQKTIDRINDQLKGHDIDPKVKQKLRYAEKNWPNSLIRYKKQEQILGKRNSFSKTDTDATFMRMKDDHMKNGQLKPGYNVQISTENQFVTNLTVHDSPTDPNTLKEHLESFEQKHDTVPQNLTADAGYGSNENYTLLENKGITAFVKYAGIHQEEKGKQSPYHHDRWKYNPEDNSFTCPNGKKMIHLDQITRKTSTGFEQTLDRYQCQSCRKCPMRSKCYKGSRNRIIEVNHGLRRQKAEVRERLYSEEGWARRKRRCWEVETFFGDIKHNRKFTRFSLRGMKKVLTESLLLAMAYNIRKMPV